MALLGRGSGVPRQVISDALWPDSPQLKQSTNLRQAIIQAKNALGPDSFLVIARDSLRVDLTRFSCPDLDFLDTTDNVGLLQFLPEMTEPWFDNLRLRLGILPRLPGVRTAAPTNVQPVEDSPVLHVLEQCLPLQPRAALEVVRAVPDLIEAAPPDRVVELLDRILEPTPSSDPLYGWGLQQRAIALIQTGRIDESRAQFAAALEHASRCRDNELIVEANVFLCAYKLVTGQAEQALAETEAMTKRLSSRQPAAIQGRIRHVHALALFHNGRFRFGFRTIEKAYELTAGCQRPYALAHIAANAAWFSATCGSPSQTPGLIKRADDLGIRLTWRFSETIELARAGHALSVNRYDEALRLCREGIARLESISAWPLIIYFEEMAALAALQLGQRREAGECYDRSRQLRKETGMRLSAWDRHRLRPLVAARLGQKSG